MTTANIVHLAHPSATENSVEGRTVIFDIQPVTHIRAIAIDWNRLFPQTRLDNGRNKLLIVLVGAIIIRTVCRDCWESVGLIVSPDQMVRRRFTGCVWGVGSIRRCFAKERIVWSKSAVDLISRDMVKTTGTRIPRLCRAARRRGQPQEA